MQEGPYILVVEDNKADLFLIREAIEGAQLDAQLEVIHDGETAVQYIEQLERDASLPCPALVLIDINLPRKNGAEVLRYLRNARRCSNAIVLVVTSSDAAYDRERMASFGANGYFRKPSDYEQFMKLGDIIKGLLSAGVDGDPNTSAAGDASRDT